VFLNTQVNCLCCLKKSSRRQQHRQKINEITSPACVGGDGEGKLRSSGNPCGFSGSFSFVLAIRSKGVGMKRASYCSDR